MDEPTLWPSPLPGFCCDCGVEPRDKRRSPLGPVCRKRRGDAQKARYRASPRGKIVRGENYERTRERRLAQMRERQRRWRATQPPRVVLCALQPCPNSFIRRHRSKRLYCDPCFAALHGRVRLLQRLPEIKPSEVA